MKKNNNKISFEELLEEACIKYTQMKYSQNDENVKEEEEK